MHKCNTQPTPDRTLFLENLTSPNIVDCVFTNLDQDKLKNDGLQLLKVYLYAGEVNEKIFSFCSSFLFASLSE